MTGMEHAIEQAAKVMQAERDHPAHLYDEAGEPRGASEQLARALAEAGLLAPTPLREEWAVYWDHIRVPVNNRAEAEQGGIAVHRWVSDWHGADR